MGLEWGWFGAVTSLRTRGASSEKETDSSQSARKAAGADRVWIRNQNLAFLRGIFPDSSNRRQPSPVHRQGGSGNPLRVVRCKENRSATDVPGRSEPG